MSPSSRRRRPRTIVTRAAAAAAPCSLPSGHRRSRLSAIFLELPIAVIKRAHLSGLEPPADAAGVRARIIEEAARQANGKCT